MPEDPAPVDPRAGHRPRVPVAAPGAASAAPLLRRYLWWPLLLALVWLAATAVGPPLPPVMPALACVVVPVLVGVRGPFDRAWTPTLLRLAAFLVPLLVVAAQNPRYDRFGLNQGQPGVVTPPVFWSHVARGQLVAVVLVEALLVILAVRAGARER